MKGLKNGQTNTLSWKLEYLENKRYISHVILIVKELGLEYNKSQLAATVKIMFSEWHKEL